MPKKTKNDSMLTDFHKNRSFILFFIYSSIFISFPIIFRETNLFHFSIFFSVSLLIILKYLFAGVARTKGIKIFQYILFFYGLWIILSSIVHYSALSSLDPLVYITVERRNAAWGLLTIKDITQLYLFFPLLYLIAFFIFKSTREVYKILYLLPIFIVPSLIVAIYQGVIDIEFLNIPYFAERGRVSGLAINGHAIGVSSFLLFSLCILAIFIIRNLWKRLFFILLAAMLFWCLLLSGSRTSFLGIIIFISVLPCIWVWANNNLPRIQRRFLILSQIVIILFIVVIIGIIPVGKKFLPSVTLLERFETTYQDFEKGGIEGVLRMSMRYDLWLQAYRLTILSPLSGWGPGGLYRNLHNIRFIHSELSMLLDNALNHYLQISSELGLLGASLNIFLHLFPLWMIFRVQKRIQNKDERLAIGIIFSTISIMMLLFMFLPFSMGVDILWILTVLLSFLFVTALKYGYSFDQVNMKLLINSLVLLTVLFFCGLYYNAFGQNGYKARQQTEWWPFKYERNCYDFERWNEGRVRWCNKDAVFQIPLPNDVPSKIEYKLIALHPDIRSNPVTVKYGGKSGTDREIVLTDHSWRTIEIPVTADSILETPVQNKHSKKYLILSFDVSRTWIPKEWGLNNDTRELGVAILLKKNNRFWKAYNYAFGQNGYKAAQQAIRVPFKYKKNCYDIEIWREGVVRWCNKNAVLQIPLPNDVPSKIEYKLIALHPDIRSNPVTVKYGGKSGTDREIVLTDRSWRTIEIPLTTDFVVEVPVHNKPPKKYLILSFDVSRTWIPKEWGVSNDTRELGVAILLYKPKPSKQ